MAIGTVGATFPMFPVSLCMDVQLELTSFSGFARPLYRTCAAVTTTKDPKGHPKRGKPSHKGNPKPTKAVWEAERGAQACNRHQDTSGRQIISYYSVFFGHALLGESKEGRT